MYKFKRHKVQTYIENRFIVKVRAYNMTSNDKNKNPYL